MIKHKLRNQIAFTFILMIFLALAAIAVINIFFLQNYYVTQKSEALKDAFEELETTSVDSGEISESLEAFCSENNLSWILTNPTNSVYKYCGQEREIDNLRTLLFGYQTGLIDDNDPKILSETDHYIIQTNHDHYMESDYVELWGTLDNGNSCLIRTPLESIRESAAISNRFFFWVGLVVLVISAILIWLLTMRLTKPISELTEISQRMSDLDFEARYRSRGRNEIDRLGENFNSMSERLESTITELKQANLELERDIKDKIEEEEKRKEFLDNVSHELKTPIALVQGYAEGLRDNVNDDPESMAYYYDVIIDEANRMNQMVRQLLNLEQVESGQDSVTLERFDIGALIRGVVQKSEILVEQQDAKVYLNGFEQTTYVWADEFKIEEVVTNFLTNALNHLDGERVIDIKLQKNGKTAHISVFNTGQPIPEEDIENIWNKFYKVDKARTRSYGGSGIGLSIVKAIMDSHQQAYGVKNYDNGVEFWFELNCD